MGYPTKRSNRQKGIMVIGVVVIACYITGIYFNETRKVTEIEPSVVSISSQFATEHASQEYTKIRLPKDQLYQGELILVNNQNKYRIDDEKNVSVYQFKNNDYVVKNRNVMLKKVTIEYLNSFLKAFKEKQGENDILILDGFRSVKSQNKILQDRILSVGKEIAQQYVASPGFSEHHTGYAIDFALLGNGIIYDYEPVGKYKWMNDNAHLYGFIVRYQEEKKALTGIANEPWHFRYVGEVHAMLMKQKQLCLEEYIEFLKQYEFSSIHLSVTIENKKYQIYYIKEEGAYQISVPKNKKYTVSGNNLDGYLITTYL